MAGTPLAQLEEPVFNMAFDREGRLWATTGGGALLLLDPATGAVLDRFGDGVTIAIAVDRSEEHTSELQSLMRISYAVFCLQHTIPVNDCMHHNSKMQSSYA